MSFVNRLFHLHICTRLARLANVPRTRLKAADSDVGALHCQLFEVECGGRWPRYAVGHGDSMSMWETLVKGCRKYLGTELGSRRESSSQFFGSDVEIE